MELQLPMFYDEAEEWAHALMLYNAALKEMNTKIEILSDEFRETHKYNPIEHIKSRIKSPESIEKKLRHSNRDVSVENMVKYINDVAGIRVICSFASDIYLIADAIARQTDIRVLKIKNYITRPKENGYMSYHMIVTVPIFLSNEVINIKVEIQIRTIAMDFWASLEHKIYYKFEGRAPERIRQELKECSEIVSFLDQKMLSLNEEIKKYNVDDKEEEIKKTLVQPYYKVSKRTYGEIAD